MNDPMPSWTRRQFLAGLAGAGALTGLPNLSAGAPLSGGQAAQQQPTVCIFSKHLEWIADYEQMARKAADLGFDGVDLTVRPGGHVLPENVEEDLPRAVEAIRAAGLEVPMMATRITDPGAPHAEAVLRTASDLGISHYRTGKWRYEENNPSVQKKLREIKPALRDLAAMSEEYQIRGNYQNHAGQTYVGASVWDLWMLLDDLDSDWMGAQFDIRHATVEGGRAWPNDFDIIAPHIQTVVMKDFRWEKEGDEWDISNVPLGEGMVDFETYLGMLAEREYSTPITLHYEYDLGGAGDGNGSIDISEQAFTRQVKRDLVRLRDWLEDAGLAS